MFIQDRKERLLSLLSWAIERKGEISMLGFPGMSSYVNIPNLALDIFAQRTKTLDRYEISISKQVVFTLLVKPI